MIPLTRQLYLAGVEAPTAARRLRQRSGTWLAVYVAAAAGVLALVAWLLVERRDDLFQLALDYVVPADWHFATRELLHRFFAQQEQLVLANAVIATALLAVQMILFPIKEQVSAALEIDAHLVPEPVEEHPLWFQAWEEAKLFLAMLAAQGSIFWLGYSDDPMRRKLAVAISFVVLAASIGVDFLSPVLQRHKLRYSQIVKTLARHPLLTLGFGALFALPALAATLLAAANPTWSFATQIGVAFGGQVLGVALAVIGGTCAGAHLVADARRRTRSPGAVRSLAWMILVGALAWNGYRFSAVIGSLHHKSQLLKCDYSIDWSSVAVETPSALAMLDAARKDALTIGLSFDVTIANPTGVDVEVEDNRVEIKQAGRLVASTQLPRGAVAAGATKQLHVTVPLTVPPSQALRIRELLTTKDWTVTLFLEVAPGFTFPVYIVTKA